MPFFACFAARFSLSDLPTFFSLAFGGTLPAMPITVRPRTDLAAAFPPPLRGTLLPMGDDRTDRRADHLRIEERRAGSDQPQAQAEAILEESDVRSEDRDAAPDSFVEHRTSDEATPPV